MKPVEGSGDLGRRQFVPRHRNGDLPVLPRILHVESNLDDGLVEIALVPERPHDIVHETVESGNEQVCTVALYAQRYDRRRSIRRSETVRPPADRSPGWAGTMMSPIPSSFAIAGREEGRAATGQHRVVTRVGASLGCNRPDRARHFRDADPNDAVGRRHESSPSGHRHSPSHGAVASGGSMLDPAAEDVRGADPAEDDVRVRQRSGRCRRGRSRLAPGRTGALRPDLQAPPSSIHAMLPAAGADRPDVQHRQIGRGDGSMPALRRGRRALPPSPETRRSWCRPCRCDQVLDGRPGVRGTARDDAPPAGPERNVSIGRSRAVLRGHDAAVRLHDQEVPRSCPPLP